MLRLIKRSAMLFGLIVFFSAIAFYCLFDFQTDSIINQATCDKIPLGWSPQEVTDVLHQEYVTPFTVFRGDMHEELIVGWADYCDNRIVVRFERRLWETKDLGATEKRFVPSSLSFAERMKRR